MDEANAIRFFTSIKEQVAILPSGVPLESACPLIGREVLQAAKSSTIETVSLRWIVPTFLECLQRYLWGGRLDPVERLHRHGPVRLDDIAADIDHLMYLFEMEYMSVDEHFQALRTNGSNFPRQPQKSSVSAVTPAPARLSSPTPAATITLSAANPTARNSAHNPAVATTFDPIAGATGPLPMEASESTLQKTPFGSKTTTFEELVSCHDRDRSRFDSVWDGVCSEVPDKDFLADNLVHWKEASRPLFARYEQSEFESSNDIIENLDKIIMDRLYSADYFDSHDWFYAHRVIIILHGALRRVAQDPDQDSAAVKNWHERFKVSFSEMKERFPEETLWSEQDLE